MRLALDGDDQLTKFCFIDGFNLAQIKAPGACGRIFSLRVVDSKAIGDEPALLSACLAALVRLIQPSTGDSRHSTRAAPSGARLWSKEGTFFFSVLFFFEGLLSLFWGLPLLLARTSHTRPRRRTRVEE